MFCSFFQSMLLVPSFVNFITGVIPRSKWVSFERFLWRITRGNLVTKFGLNFSPSGFTPHHHQPYFYTFSPSVHEACWNWRAHRRSNNRWFHPEKRLHFVLPRRKIGNEDQENVWILWRWEKNKKKKADIYRILTLFFFSDRSEPLSLPRNSKRARRIAFPS